MILEQLTLRNFCLYRGEQTLDLAPARTNGGKAPIVLVGGINGGGKTTLLDAVQLTLYGSRARLSKRSKSYSDFLRECIHRGVDPDDGASVSLSFRYAAEGNEHLYQVTRTWNGSGKASRDKVHVSKDGVVDQWLSDSWNELVEELIPIGISQLFFFDAEKIRLLAEDDTGNVTLGAAIKSLLGLDLAERLISDASVLETRLSQRAGSAAHSEEIAALEAELAENDSAIRKKKAERASLENDRLRAENELVTVEEKFASVGGHHWQERESRRLRLAELETQQSHLEAQLVTLAASELPLALVPKLVARVESQHRMEQESAEASTVAKLLDRRDSQMLKALQQQGVPESVVDILKRLQDADRTRRNKTTKTPVRLALSDAAHNLLKHLRNYGLTQRLEESKRLLDALHQVRRDSESLQRALQAVPGDSEIGDVVEMLKSAAESSAVINARAKRLDADIHMFESQRDETRNKLRKLRRRDVDRQIQTEEAARMAQLAIRTQEQMDRFLARATADKIDRLSGLVTDSFRFLLRKRTLVERVQIDPTTFAITLYGNGGNAIPKQRLSEGEKQVFAVSLLWGLAQASPRPLPTIIDTPMARLDAKHRSHLIERYFPNASHQVIILSTDTEVDREYYEALQPHISRAYHLNYDESKKVTVAEEGYFWQARTVEQEAQA